MSKDFLVTYLKESLAEEHKLRDMLIGSYQRSKKRNIELAEENATLRRALTFYAKPENYEPWREEDEDRTDAFNFVDLDGGDTAREALK